MRSDLVEKIEKTLQHKAYDIAADYNIRMTWRWKKKERLLEIVLLNMSNNLGKKICVTYCVTYELIFDSFVDANEIIIDHINTQVRVIEKVGEDEN